MSSEQDKAAQHILIIGAGVAGNALALFLNKANSSPLSKRKFTCTVYEAYPRTEKVYIGGGLGLAPNGVAVLADLGLEEQVTKRGGVAKGSTFWTEKGSVIGHWSHEGFGNYMYGMMRSTLYDIVKEEMEKKGLSIEYKKRAVKVEERGDEVYVEFADGSSAQGAYLIACDGIVQLEMRLTVRRQLSSQKRHIPRLSQTRVHWSQRSWRVCDGRPTPAKHPIQYPRQYELYLWQKCVFRGSSCFRWGISSKLQSLTMVGNDVVDKLGRPERVYG